MYKGNKIGNEYLTKYSKKLGISVPEDSEMDFTIKFGAFSLFAIIQKLNRVKIINGSLTRLQYLLK